MDFSYSDEQRLLCETTRRLTERHASPQAIRKLDAERSYPYDIYQAWVEAGLFGLPHAQEFGGADGSLIDLVLVAETLSRPSGDIAMAFGGTTFCGLNLARMASDAQRRLWIPKIIAGEVRMSISMSEPEAGSDIGAMRTTARRDGEDYVINGRKIWATAAGARDNVINMYVRTDPSASYRNGLSLFLIDAETPGLDLRRLDMLGRRSVGTYEITLDNVRVPADRLVGGENNGWHCVLGGLQVERVVAAACDCGTARGIVDMAVAYARERKQFGRAIGTFQSIGHRLAQIEAEVEAAWALTQKAAWSAANGDDALKQITMAKLLAAEAYVKAADTGMQVMGGFGYSMEFDMQRHFRDARAATIAAGTSEIQRNLVAGLMGLKVL